VASPATSCHLVLVGTSLLRNALAAVRSGRVSAPPGCGEVLAACADPARLDRGRCGREIDRCLGFVGRLVEEDPYRMSAELNAMDWVLESGCGDVARLVLLASDTPEGLAAARVLEGYLSSRGCPARVRVVRGLGSSEGFWPGLLELVKVIAEEARAAYADGYFVYLNATGGFKPESGMALLAASAAAPVAAYYKHEAMRETVMLPLLPVRPDGGRLRAMTSKLLLAAKPGARVELDDPAYEDIRWLLIFLARSGVAQLRDGALLVDERVAEALSTIARIYEVVAGWL